MNVATTSTIHKSVVFLLKQQGYSALEAERRWDEVYSRLFQQAAPNVQHAWVIGEYTLEFIKRTRDTEPEDLTPAPVERSGAGAVAWLFIFGLIAVIAGAVIIF